MSNSLSFHPHQHLVLSWHFWLFFDHCILAILYVVSHCSVSFHFLMGNDVGHLLMCIFVICNPLQWDVFMYFPYYLFELFCLLVLNFKTSLCIRDTSLLSNMWFANTVSCSVACLILFTWTSTEQTFLILMRANLILDQINWIFIKSTFTIMSYAFSVRSKQSLLVLDSKNFIDLHFTFKSVIHSESIFV